MQLEQAIRNVTVSDPSVFGPVIFDLSQGSDAEALRSLLEVSQPITIHDVLLDQLKESIAAGSPSRKLGPEEMALLIAERFRGAGGAGSDGALLYGRWIYYPWSHCLLHLLPPTEFHALRTDRNRHKILADEQALLRKRRIGIAGLSVGNAAALTLLLEGIGGEFRLADFDHLSLSNLNRIRARLVDLGVNKAVLAARQMFEIDPYVHVEIFSEGLDDSNLDRFFGQTETDKLDLLVEECDDLYMKTRLRERARSLGVPVLMDTSDGGLLDIERFDLELTREPFHGLMSGVSAENIKHVSSKEKIPFVLRVLGSDRMSATGAASLAEIGETISTWPQLASAVCLGGALVADTARRILLGRIPFSGRFSIDLEKLIQESTRNPLPIPTSNASASNDSTRSSASADATTPQSRLLALPLYEGGGAKKIDRDEVRFLVECGILAPSGGNVQPWRFHFEDGVLACFVDAERSQGTLNYAHRASYVAVGAAVENIALAARAIGLEPNIRPFPKRDQPLLVCELTFSRAPREETALFQAIARRVTNRRRGHARALTTLEIGTLTKAARERGAELSLFMPSPQMDEIVKILGEVDRFRFLAPTLHRELISELRLTPKEVFDTRDGIDVATLELTATDRAILEILARSSTSAELQRIGGGQGIVRATGEDLSDASALALVSVPSGRNTPESYFAGGRAMERVWLTATELGLAIKPHSAALYFFARLREGLGFDAGHDGKLWPLAADFARIAARPPDASEILLFKLRDAEAPTARSLRRSVEQCTTGPSWL